VVRDIKYARLDESPRPYMYAPAAQVYSASMTLQVRGDGDTAAILARVRAYALAVDPALQVLQSGPLSSTRRAATSLYETLARMLTLIGILTVGVVALGVYGLVAYAVRQSRHAIGVRTALGATRPAIVRHFLRQGMTLTAAGVAIGIAAAFTVTRLMTTLLFGVAATDVTSFIVATVIVLAAALVASFSPAWRAASDDPIAALRHR
jgi:ABC-type antimicrobial peptide transport system permease subunit